MPTSRVHFVYAYVQFLRRHVRMADVRQYLADALAMYGSLVDFKPAPGNTSICYSGPALLAQFGFPYEADRRLIAETYPWLANFTQPGCPPPAPPSAAYAPAAGPAANLAASAGAAAAAAVAGGSGRGNGSFASANQTAV